MLPDGGVCFTGAIIDERMEADEAFKPGSWPWQAAIMQGDARAAVAWPDRETSAKGCVALGVMDPAGQLRVIFMRDFDRVSTMIDAAGRMQEGLGLMMRDLTAWGVREICVQADDVIEAGTWWDLLERDPSTKGMKMPINPVDDMTSALTVWAEMAELIVVQRANAVAMEQANAAGKVTPMKKALAMMTMSYKWVARRRVKPEDMRWERWR